MTGLELNQSVRDPQSGREWTIWWCHRTLKPLLSDFTCTRWNMRRSTCESSFRDSMTGISKMSCKVLGATVVLIQRKPQSPWDDVQLLTRFLKDRCRLMLAHRTLSCNRLLGSVVLIRTKKWTYKIDFFSWTVTEPTISSSVLAFPRLPILISTQ